MGSLLKVIPENNTVETNTGAPGYTRCRGTTAAAINIDTAKIACQNWLFR